MKALHYITLIGFLISPIFSNAQTYGNEWIDYTQSYYSFKIVDDGIYRLDYATLDASGIPLSTFQSANIQIFGKEREIPLHVEDGGDGSLDPGDYILFYAERNDGWLDSTIFVDPNTIGNPSYSLYNDTLTYFFTWNSSTNNYRYTVETDLDFSTYTAADYILYQSETSYANEYHEGVKTSGASSSFFTPGEGWGSNKVNGGGGGYTANLSLWTRFPYIGAGAPNANFTAFSVSASDAAASGDNHHLQWLLGASNTDVFNQTWNGYDQRICNASVSPTLLTAGSTPIKFNIIDDLGVATDFQAYQYLTIEYPRQPNFNGQNNVDFKVINSTQAKIRLDVTSAGYNAPLMLVHGDIPRIVPFVPNGAFHSVIIPNSSNGSNQTVIYKDSALIQQINTLSAVNGNGQFNNFSTYNAEEALLLIYHSSMTPASEAYEDYRQSLAGGSHTTILANVDELYMQFGGGIEKHINGIRRFAHFIYNNTTEKPVGLFLMGKGIREANFNITTADGPGTRHDPIRFAESKIPSFGQPSSDVAITAGLEGTKLWVPLIPTGRISARENDELQDYLDKVQEYEIAQDSASIYDSPNKDWQKHVIHFAGGSNITEQTSFQGYMNGLENRISDSLFGADVMRVYKSSSNPLDPTILSSVTDRISEGVSLMSYFGHASGTSSGFEINLDDPASWNNQGKYPVMLVNSCYNGNIFQLTESKSEEFVQVANYGAIGYIASVGLGYSFYLIKYSENLYDRFSNEMYGATLGEMMQSNIDHLEPNGGLFYETTCMQMVLNGDPMLKLNTHLAPEIEITEQSVSFQPAEIDLTIDSIEMQIVIKNLGHSISDTFNLIVERDFPNSPVDSIYFFEINGLDYTDTVNFKMPLQANIAVGANVFSIRVDIPSLIPEHYDEIGNNQISITKTVNIKGIIPVIPYEFAVVPDDSVTLIASTTDPIADYNTYRFEIDTVDFEGTVSQSGEYRYALVSGIGGVQEINPSEWIGVNSGMSQPLLCEDSAVYFWRVAIQGDTNWRESSFQYINGKTGWGQDHFYQFKKNGFYNIEYERNARKRNFNPTIKTLECNVNSSFTTPQIYENNYLIDGQPISYGIGVSATPKIHVVVIDPSSYFPWLTGQGNATIGGYVSECFGNNNCNTGFWSGYYTFLQNDTTQLAEFQDMVLNEVPDGHYLLIYSPMTTRYDWWDAIDSANMYNTFASLSSSSIVPGLQNTPFAFFTKKGDPSSVIEILATPGGEINLLANMIGPNDYGEEQSTLIGPSAEWGNVYWKQDPEELSTNDSTVFSIKGYDINGALQLTIDTLFTLNDSIIDLNTIVDASLYPYIDLKASYSDSTSFTPAQIDRWHVLFTPLPEAAIDQIDPYTWTASSDSLSEGQEIDFAIDIRNIYNIDMDSLLVSYWVEDANQVKHIIEYPRQDSLRVGETLRDTITISTSGLGGINSFWMEVNPYINGSLIVTDQPEQLHFNNLLQIPFYVNADDENPILDVTFNGNHILNGDIIDPNSEILITLKDDNEYLIMDDISDTTLFGVYLTDPSGTQVRIPFVDGNTGETVMIWTPANTQNKRFKINWPTEFMMDGTYTLLVQGTDRSGNVSGDIEYSIEFEIIHESTITRMMNYPNPFSTSTRFVFTLTGSEVPDDIIIQIMTVTGRVVREITEDQLGEIEIGRNITEYAWDGTDEFGDPLANGVYLYRVKAQIGGESIEHRDSGADQYFTKDFGKMYLLR